MAAPRKTRFWRLCRIYFRRFRIAVWLCVLFALGMLIYFNQIGLPGIIKKPLLEKLRARGIDLQFSRLRLRWNQGLVAENVRFGQMAESLRPEITAAEVQVHLDYRALSRLQVQVDSLRLRQGSVVWPVPDNNQTNRQLSIQNIQTDLRLLPGDQWQLDHLTANLAGARIQFSGALTNASAVSDWRFLHAERATPAGLWQSRLRGLADILEQIRFSSTPDLRLDIRGDARDLLSFQVRLMVNTPGAETPWGSVKEGKFTAHLFPGGSNELSRARINLEAVEAQTKWAAATNLQAILQLVSVVGETNLVNCNLSLAANSVGTQWAGGTNLQFSAQWIHGLTNPVPLQGRGELVCEQAVTEWGRARELRLQGQLAPLEAVPVQTDPSWAWWAGLAPYPLDWQLHALDLENNDLSVASLSCDGRWRAPHLSMTNFFAELYGGKLKLNADLNTGTRRLNAKITSNVDPHKVEPVLTPGARQWLSQFSWRAPPEVEGIVSLILPAWTNRTPDWRAEVQPALRLEGGFNAPSGGTFRDVQAASAHSHFSYSNMVWRLPDLVVTRPEGRVEVEHVSDDRSKDFYWRVRCGIDPLALRPVLDSNQLRGLDLITFSEPPRVEAEIWGRWHSDDLIGMRGQVALTNFSFRGEHADSLQTTILYTNHFLTFVGAEAHRGSGRYKADGVVVDIDAQKIYLTNGFSTGDPMVVARAIGPHVVRAIEPYQFLKPPTAWVHGVIPMEREDDADLYFTLDGGPFHWWKFNVPRIKGDVHWAGPHLNLTDVAADFYGGKLSASAGFEFSESRGVDYHFAARATNILLKSLMADLSTKTNNLDGTLNAKLVIKRGNLSKSNDFDGYGSVDLRDGLIWAIPVFGVVSPALDTLLPGLGSSRATSGSGTFIITNGVIWSDDTEFRSAAMRIQYRGSVDLDGRVNARVEAQVLRDVWLVGPIVSTVFWPFAKMFEYKVTGTLAQPKTEALYLGKLVGMPFHPIRTLKELGPPDVTGTASNAPPIFSIPP